MKRGFTLLETAVVISIIILIAALLFPVYARAKRAAKITKSMSNMRQLHQAILIYIGGDVSLNPAKLPHATDLMRSQKLPIELFHTGGNPYGGIDGHDVYAWMFPHPDLEPVQSWYEHIRNTNGNPILIVDGTQNDRIDSSVTPFETRLGLGIYFDGHIEKRKHTGSSNRYEVWE